MCRFAVTSVHAAFFTASFVLLAGSDGCETRKYHVITRIEPDGAISRSIEQPRDDTLPPEALVKPKTYPPSTQPADYFLRPDWARLWSESQPATEPANDAPDKSSVKASGSFPSADRIPRNYHLIAWPLEDRFSTNRIEHTYQDYVLFGIDDWSETFTETVRLYEYVDTLDEMIRTMLPAFEATLDETLGSQYDFTELKTVLRSQGATLVRRYALMMYQFGGNQDNKGISAQQEQQTVAILAAAGLNVPLNEKGEIDGDKVSAAARAFFLRLFQEKVRSRNTGEHLNAQQATKLAKALNLDFPPPQSQPATATQPAAEGQAASKPATAAASQPTSREASPWDQAEEIFRRQFEKLNGQSLEQAALAWGATTGGAHRVSPANMFDPASRDGLTRQFEYEFQAAGTILETNGQRTGDCSVTWTVTHQQFWPEGYRMHARAIRWNRPAERAIFGREVLANIGSALKLKETIGDRQPVRDALKQAIAERSANPLRQLATSGDAGAAQAVWEILALATQPSP